MMQKNMSTFQILKDRNLYFQVVFKNYNILISDHNENILCLGILKIFETVP